MVALDDAGQQVLEEIADADLLLHVVDASDPDAEQQIETVDSLLEELGAADLPRFTVFNKCDRLAEGVPSPSPAGAADQFHISALDRRTTRPLMEAIESRFWSRASAVESPPRPEAT